MQETDRILPVVPMFHANAWGLAHAAVASGATLVMPGPDLSGPAIAKLIEEERVTIAAGVPTIWMGVLPELKGRDTSALRAIPCGGSAVPRALSEAYREQTGPADHAGVGHDRDEPDRVGRAHQVHHRRHARRRRPRRPAHHRRAAVDRRRRPHRAARAAPRRCRGTARAPASSRCAARGSRPEYYNDDRSPESFTEDGWLKTGDVAVIDRHGYIRLVDRTKDVIKSGGEWISSVDLENELMGHPKVAEAAVIGVPHPKWAERPLACVVVRPGEELTKDEVLAYLEDRVAKWWLPDDVVFVDEIPKTSVGKFSKKDLRDKFAGYQLPTA